MPANNSFTYMDHYGRKWNGPFHFNLNNIIGNAPREFGVYQVIKKNGNQQEVMYIGIATGKTILERLRSHCTGLGNKHIAGIGNTSEFWFSYWLCDPLSAKQIESNVITTQKPPFNIRSEYQHYIESIYIH
jgi:excinuclease UvrABC nuclease subunit